MKILTNESRKPNLQPLSCPRVAGLYQATHYGQVYQFLSQNWHEFLIRVVGTLFFFYLFYLLRTMMFLSVRKQVTKMLLELWSDKVLVTILAFLLK